MYDSWRYRDVVYINVSYHGVKNTHSLRKTEKKMITFTGKHSEIKVID